MDKISIEITQVNDEDFRVRSKIHIDDRSSDAVLAYMEAIMEEIAVINTTSFVLAAANVVHKVVEEEV